MSFKEIDFPFQLNENLLNQNSNITLKFAISGRAVIFNKNNQLLLVSTDNKDWHFPGGMIDTVESSQDACIREVYEETGFKIKVKKFLCITESVYDSRIKFENFLRLTNIFYLCEIDSENQEIIQNWLDPDNNLIKYRKYFNEKDYQALEYNKSSKLSLLSFEEIKNLNGQHLGFTNLCDLNLQQMDFILKNNQK